MPIATLCLNYATLFFLRFSQSEFFSSRGQCFQTSGKIPGQRAKMTGQGAKNSRTGGQIFSVSYNFLVEAPAQLCPALLPFLQSFGVQPSHVPNGPRGAGVCAALHVSWGGRLLRVVCFGAEGCIEACFSACPCA